MQRMDKDEKAKLFSARVKRRELRVAKRNAIDMRPDFHPVKTLPLDVIEPFGCKLDVLHGYHPNATKLVRGACDHLNDVIVHDLSLDDQRAPRAANETAAQAWGRGFERRCRPRPCRASAAPRPTNAHRFRGMVCRRS